MKNKTQNTGSGFDKKITRKEAIRKTGITALTAASIVFLATKASASNSNPTPPGSNW